MFDAGVANPLDELLGLIHLVVCGVDIDGLDVPAAARVVEQCAEAERVLAALRVMTAARLEGAAVWRGEGFRSVAAWMAAKTGTAVGPAIDAVEMAGQLADRWWPTPSGAGSCPCPRPSRSSMWPRRHRRCRANWSRRPGSSPSEGSGRNAGGSRRRSSSMKTTATRSAT
jgi:hypothetical protein